MPYQIEIADTVPGTVLELRRAIRPEQIGNDIGAGLAELYSKVEATGLHPAGPPSVTYLDPMLPGHPMNVDIGVPIVPGTGHVDLDEGVRLVGRHSRPTARTVHHGDYAGINAAYQALEEWLLGHGYRSAGPPIETYLVGPNTTPDPAGYRTEVSIPVVPSICLSVRIEGDFTSVAGRTRQILRENGFDVLTEVDLRATLREKVDADMEYFLILGTCVPELAKRALDIDRQVGVLMPCAVTIRADGDHIVVEALDPTILVRTTGRGELAPIANEARERLTAVLASLHDQAQRTEDSPQR